MQVFLAKERGKTIRGTGGGKHAGFLGKGEREKTIIGTRGGKHAGFLGKGEGEEDKRDLRW